MPRCETISEPKQGPPQHTARLSAKCPARDTWWQFWKKIIHIILLQLQCLRGFQSLLLREEMLYKPEKFKRTWSRENLPRFTGCNLKLGWYQCYKHGNKNKSNVREKIASSFFYLAGSSSITKGFSGATFKQEWVPCLKLCLSSDTRISRCKLTPWVQDPWIL